MAPYPSLRHVGGGVEHAPAGRHAFCTETPQRCVRGDRNARDLSRRSPPLRRCGRTGERYLHRIFAVRALAQPGIRLRRHHRHAPACPHSAGSAGTSARAACQPKSILVAVGSGHPARSVLPFQGRAGAHTNGNRPRPLRLRLGVSCGGGLASSRSARPRRISGRRSGAGSALQCVPRAHISRGLPGREPELGHRPLQQL